MTENDPELTSMQRLTPITFGLIAVNVVVFVLAERVGSTTEARTLLHVGAVERYHVWMGEWWRLLTPVFLHVGLWHLVWNAYASIGWSRPVERTLGPLRFLLVYALGGIAAAATSVLGHDVVSVGASGAVFAITGAALVLRYRIAGSLKRLFDDAENKRILVSMAVWALIGVWLGLDNYAHLGGFVVGLLLTSAMTAPERASRRQTFAVFALSFVGAVTFALRPWWKATTADGEILGSYGASYYLGDKQIKDYPRALKFLNRACATGSANACAVHGFMYARGDGVARDDARAAALYREACDGKSSFGCAALGRATVLGHGVDKDPAKANEYFSQACDLGQSDGCAGVGISLYQGTGVARDKARGLTILEQACQAGSTIACKMRLDPDSPPEW
ncbi:hypothetical protein BH09MYX1_BH09MYX1_64980 [soil metagenome]